MRYVGQYFYFPFFVENTELHIGPRPRDSIYSGGYTAWQDSQEKERNFQQFLTKILVWMVWKWNKVKGKLNLF
jgi:hypothetical protein